MKKCDICGGTVRINPETRMGVCDSCGNTTEIDEGTAQKYKTIVRLAEQKMLRNTSKSYAEALSLFESVECVEGVEEKIRSCRSKIIELKEAEAKNRVEEKKTEGRDTKAGVVIVVLIVIALLALLAGLIFVIVKIVRGELTGPALYVTVGLFALLVIAFCLKKLFVR